MRSSSVLDALFSKTKQRILSAVLLQPGHAWYLLELARHLGVRPSSLQRELKTLATAGVLKRRQDGRRVYFQADAECPIFQDLAQILFKTAGMVDALKAAFKPLQKRIQVAFIFGSVAASAERSTSDIDLMIVGSVPLSAVAPVLRHVEKNLGRAVNPHVYNTEEFVGRLRRPDHFLSAILREERLFIIGRENDLEAVAASSKDKTASH